jgi:hypothetical protein
MQHGVLKWRAEKAQAEGNEKAYLEALKAMDDVYRGYALGRLVVIGRLDRASGITEEQHDAGAWFCKILSAMARIEDAPSISPKSPAASVVSGSVSNYLEDSPEWREDIKRRFREVQGHIFRADRETDPIFTALVCVLREDRDILPGDVGALRIGLNAIDKYLNPKKFA